MTDGFSDPRVRVDKAFKKRLAKKPPKMQAAIIECVERLIDDPGHPGLRSHPVISAPGVFSSRVDRGNRLTWTREGDLTVLLNHCNHDEVYRPY